MKDMKNTSYQLADENPGQVPLVIRDDGFSMFYTMDPDKMNKEYFLSNTVDFLKDQKPVIKEFGLGPGSVFTFDTNVGEKFGDGLTDRQKNQLRKGDLRVIENINKLINAGNDPLKIVVERCKKIGLKTWARLEMNHEYGPASDDNYLWVGFVGSLNKNNPQYRLNNSVRLDFKYKQVRDFKLNILKEAAQRGVDGISLDFCVYPPFLSNPKKNSGIMTEFIRNVRQMLDSCDCEKRIDLIVRVPFDCEKYGLKWEEWMEKHLIDVIIPSVVFVPDKFDVPVSKFVKKGKECGCKVFGCIRPCFGRVTTDDAPDDEKQNIKRKEKPVSKEMYYAKSMLLLKSGVDGMQIALGSGDKGEWRPVHNTLGNGKLLKYKDKEYYLDRRDQLPMIFSKNNPDKTINIRVADKINKKQGTNRVVLTLYSRGLKKGEYLDIKINNEGPLTLTRDDFTAKPEDKPIVNPASMDPKKLFSIEKWWDIGKNEFELLGELINSGSNTIEFNYRNDNSENAEYIISDMSITFLYNKNNI